MKHICITGAAGYIGSHLTKNLADNGNIVHAFVRPGRKEAHLMHPAVKIFDGDLLDCEALDRAMRSCDEVYHLAAFVGAWHTDPSVFERINVTGTKNVLETARKVGVRRVVFTSTAAVFGASPGSSMNHESMHDTQPITRYAQSKRQAEIMIGEVNTKDCEIVVVNPSRVYGPDIRRCVTVVNGIVHRYMQRRICLLPGNGEAMANWAFIDDVVRGHVQAMAMGKPGHRYILGGHNLSNNAFFDKVGEVSGRSGKILRVRSGLLKIYAHCGLLCGRLGILSPVITPDVVRKLTSNCRLDCTKAKRELAYSITPLEKAMTTTVNWLHKIYDYENGSNIPDCPQ